MNHLCTALVLCSALAAGLPAAAQTHSPDFVYGSPIAPEQAFRTIVIGPQTRWVNVMRGETIRFQVGNASFGWRFDGPGSRPVDLQRVAPAGMLAQPVTAYVTAGGEFGRSQF